MAKIHHHPHRPANPQRSPEGPQAAGSEARQTTPQKDGFLKGAVRGIYEKNPLVMLCTQPALKEAAEQIPIIKTVAEAVCPSVEALDEYVQGKLLK